MKDHQAKLIKHGFLDFMFRQIDKLKEQGMSDREAAEMVMDVVFLTIHNTWVDAYGAKQMAEEFYQVADGLVAKSMESSE